MNGISMRWAFAPGVFLMMMLAFAATTGRAEVSGDADSSLAMGIRGEDLQEEAGSGVPHDATPAARSVGWFECSQSEDPATVLRRAAESGTIAYRLSRPDEIVALLGEPLERKESRDGGMLRLDLVYDGLIVRFGRMAMDKSPFTIQAARAGDASVPIGEDRPVVLRSNADLETVDSFWGLQDLSLVNTDLRSEKEFLGRMTFDTLTRWPPAERLPFGFDPAAMIERGKDPGLGVRSLHERGIDGRGVVLAIIDQPLLREHQEYAARLVRYDAEGLEDMPPQMHGSPVASIAVGRRIGVAPGAALTYLAIPMWQRDNAVPAAALRKILDWNASRPTAEKVRVISLSTGGFDRNPNLDDWLAAVSEAESRGILVMTCDPSPLYLGTLTLREGGDPDDPGAFKPGRYASAEDELRVPTGNKTIASHRGPDVYTYEREGGRSWAAPYVAGLAALAFQVDPTLSPASIRRLLVETATRTEAGPVVSPVAFIARVEAGRR